MVVVEDFDVQLVSADHKYYKVNKRKFSNSTNYRRIPFPEHTHATQTYVEVEPDEDYFISIEKIRRSTHKLYTDYYVDGKSLHFHVTWESECISTSPRFVGIHSRDNNGMKTTQALKFVKATFTSASAHACHSNSSSNKNDQHERASSSSSMAGMGQIQMLVFEAIPKQMKKRGKVHPASSFSASAIAMNPSSAVVSKKSRRITSSEKNVRSGTGTASMEGTKGETESRYYLSHTKGQYLYTITLYYCATPGLIAVGILSQPPDYWTHAHTVHPTTQTGLEMEHIQKGIKSEHIDDNTGNTIIELNDNDDDNNDNDNAVDENNKSITDKKKTDDNHDETQHQNELNWNYYSRIG